jgi:hypothetical protein
MIDRASGRVLADPAATFQRAGLNLREYNLSMLNRYDDRLFFGTSSGMVICLREIGETAPRLLRDPKALRFGYIPPEGIKKTPPPAAAAAETPAEPAAEPKDEAAKDEAAAPPAEKKAKDKPGAESDEPKE